MADQPGEATTPWAYEQHWAKVWEERGYFKAEAPSTRPVFSMAIPPPNITGSLHMGHALTVSIEDLVSRYHRMRGENVLWLPGIDHAGIATQMVVERELKKEGLDRRQLGREKFLERVWQWKEKSSGRIVEQLKMLGCSVDWSRARFTLDPALSRAVRKVFVSLYEEGLIYRAQRLINWCPGCQTAISDLEVDHKEQKGKLWQIGYRVEGTDVVLPVATTRPETLLGDTGVAVHPDDARYKQLIGKRAIVPLVDRPVPIFGDATLVSMEFGTGVVKVTPAHDFNDFEAGKRNGLATISIFDEQARVNQNGGPYAGLGRTEARKKVLADLEAKGLLLKTEDHKLALATCQRSGDVVEPFLAWNWFVKIEPLAKPALAAVEDGRIRIIPETWKATYFHWMRNIHDWCISRQLWWGHRIPAWHCACGEIVVAEVEPAACPQCQGTKGKLTPDPDVLDTWFSSALWPFSTLGWPDKTPDLETFYPTTLMETGSDILFFWVARMIMMGLKFTGQVPFRDVYLHAIVRDAEGEKMSKTKGNVIDPLDITKEYGADALRFALLSQSAQGRDIKMSVDRVASNRAFVTKISNASRFALMHAEGFDPKADNDSGGGLAEAWIRSRLAATAQELHQAIAEYQFPEAALVIYRFIWNDLCDWYIELAKGPLTGGDPARRQAAQAALFGALDGGLRLLHPFMPFITEEIWQKIPRAAGPGPGSETICLASLPDGSGRDMALEQRFDRELRQIVERVRSLRGSCGIPVAKRIAVTVLCRDAQLRDAVAAQRSAIQALTQAAEVRVEVLGSKPANTIVALIGAGEVHVPLSEVPDRSEALARLEKDIAAARKDREMLVSKLGTASFRERAPKEILEKDEARVVELTGREAELTGYLRSLREAAA